MRGGRIEVLRRAILFCGVAAAFAFGAARLTAPTDDAFISYRYAQHLVEGEGLVFNAGERVEGFTNLLWVLVLAAGGALGFDLPALSRALSALCAAALVVSMVRFSSERLAGSGPRVLRFSGAVMLALHPLFTVMNGSGLETTFFALLTWWAVTAYLSPETDASAGWRTGLFLALAYLARPEAMFWLACFLATDLLSALRGSRLADPHLGRALRYSVVVVATIAIHLGWRWSYYGDLLPNTFYVKAGEHWSWGVNGIRAHLASTGWIPLVALVGVPLCLRRRWSLCLWSIVLVYLLFVLRTGGSRYLYPLLPLEFLLVQELMRDAWLRGGRRLGAPLCAVVCGLYLAGLVWEGQNLVTMSRYNRLLSRHARSLATCLEPRTRADDLIAVVAAGELPYHLDRPILDMLGLNDRHIAREGLRDPSSLIWHHVADPSYVLERGPRVIVMPDRPEAPILAVRGLLRSPRFRNDYVWTRLPCPGGGRGVFVRRDDPLPALGRISREREGTSGVDAGASTPGR